MKHRQLEITIRDLNGNDKKVKVDKGIAKEIFYLNNFYHLNTLYSCQGDNYNGGYVKFVPGTDMGKAIDALNVLMPKAICILDFNEIVRFFKTSASWKNHEKFLRNIQRYKEKPRM